MTTPSQLSSAVFRKPVRITVTIPRSTFEQLQSRSDQEGRSMSNLTAYLLEGALKPIPSAPLGV